MARQRPGELDAGQADVTVALAERVGRRLGHLEALLGVGEIDEQHPRLPRARCGAACQRRTRVIPHLQWCEGRCRRLAETHCGSPARTTETCGARRVASAATKRSGV